MKLNKIITGTLTCIHCHKSSEHAFVLILDSNKVMAILCVDCLRTLQNLLALNEEINS